ncbi:glycosyl transferase [Bacteroidia bacterium]|nr:glycosyl transferase [Bacteroidia bacterium]
MNVFVIIVTYNGRKWYDKCFENLRNSSIPVQTVVIDNASTDDTVSYIRENYPEIYLIESNKNLGFGKANNIGIEYALERDCDYIFLLNQDAYIDPDTIKKLIEISIENPEYGIISPMQLNGRKDDFDKGFSIWVKHLWNFNTYTNLFLSEKLDKKVYPVKFVMAALWLLPYQCVNKIGGFDPIFPHYGEDVDYVNRVHYHGYKAGICPSAIGYHDREERIFSKKRELEKFYVEYLFILKNINRSVTFSIIHCFLLIILRLFRSILILDMMSFRFNIKCICNLTKQYSQIYYSRKESSLGDSGFLNI